MKIFIDICTVFCRIKKNAQVCIYSLADINMVPLKGSWVDFLTFLRYRSLLKFPVSRISEKYFLGIYLHSKA